MTEADSVHSTPRKTASKIKPGQKAAVAAGTAIAVQRRGSPRRQPLLVSAGRHWREAMDTGFPAKPRGRTAEDGRRT
jgi:hypothetical protein